jgi:hypothetical protein
VIQSTGTVERIFGGSVDEVGLDVCGFIKGLLRQSGCDLITEWGEMC